MHTLMKTLLIAATGSTLLPGPATAADMSLPFKAPMPPPAFSWTGCYLGAHVGGGWAHKEATDPVNAIQSAFTEMTTGVTTVTVDPIGVVVGGQIGCDYQFAPTWVVGVEGAASGSTMKASANFALPASGDTGEFSALTDFVASATGRFGYAADHWLFYAKAGAAWVGDKYDFTGSVTGTPVAFEGLDQRLGWTVGGGIDWAFYHHWSLALEYDYYQFGSHTVLMIDPNNAPAGVPVNFKQSVQIAKLALNFHMWDGR
ncbi:MAG TPA: outer membrane beta-barrel protein [Xanthobacteraceae bacterium]|nr:outer membrane beta-barrel protein [Xanthobacteraceae bacterium]